MVEHAEEKHRVRVRFELLLEGVGRGVEALLVDGLGDVERELGGVGAGAQDVHAHRLGRIADHDFGGDRPDSLQ